MLNKFRLNGRIKREQFIRFSSMGFGFIVVLMLILIASKGGHKKHKDEPLPDFTGVVDSQFSEADTESAMTSQQLELESLKKQVASLVEGIKNRKEHSEQDNSMITAKLMEEMAQLKLQVETKSSSAPNPNPVLASNEPFFPGSTASDASYQTHALTNRLNKPHSIHSVSFWHHSSQVKPQRKTAINYVPSGAFAKAVVLGGVDADASVDGQNKNNGVMLFKILNAGTLPNGKRSHLAGCVITASAYGDISSERAYAKLDKISCAFDGQPIIDKSVTGWVFFAGKVGIKGHPLMRDGKIVTWAGVSGALSGVAQAAQYAQSVQNFSPYGGATSVIPSGNIGAFSAFGGASKAADQLSQYYIKRAEQYHPVIQVGSGNVVNIVFKDGFYLDDMEEEEHQKNRYQNSRTENSDPLVPQEVLTQLNQAQLGDEVQTKGVSQ